MIYVNIQTFCEKIESNEHSETIALFVFMNQSILVNLTKNETCQGINFDSDPQKYHIFITMKLTFCANFSIFEFKK